LLSRMRPDVSDTEPNSTSAISATRACAAITRKGGPPLPPVRARISRLSRHPDTGLACCGGSRGPDTSRHELFFELQRDALDTWSRQVPAVHEGVHAVGRSPARTLAKRCSGNTIDKRVCQGAGGAFSRRKPAQIVHARGKQLHGRAASAGKRLEGVGQLRDARLHFTIR
jgi:hypothetical protein